MKVRVKHFINGDYYIQYKELLFWYRLEYTWDDGSGTLLSRNQPMIFDDFESAVNYMNKLTPEKIKEHNEYNNKLYADLKQKYERLRKERERKTSTRKI